MIRNLQIGSKKHIVIRLDYSCEPSVPLNEKLDKLRMDAPFHLTSLSVGETSTSPEWRWRARRRNENKLPFSSVNEFLVSMSSPFQEHHSMHFLFNSADFQPANLKPTV